MADVDRAGVTVFAEPLDISTCEEPYCMPGGEFADDGRATEPTARTFSASSRARISGLDVWSAGS